MITADVRFVDVLRALETERGMTPPPPLSFGQGLIEGTRRFVEMIRPEWAKIAAFGDDCEALLLYDLFFLSGTALRIADHYVAENGKITSETIVWDTHGSPFRQALVA